jgi:hypothetical protein
MSRQAMWEEIVKLKGVAEVTTQTYIDELESLINAMEDGGLPLPVAVKLIRGIWGNSSRANSLMVQLSECFPETNKSVVLYAGLPAEEARKQLGELKETREYFELIYTYIDQVVNITMKGLVAAEFTVENQSRLNDFRCEVLKYIAYTGDYFYEAEQMLKDGSLLSWDQLNRVPDVVINGDYLFVNEFKATLAKAHADYLEGTFKPDVKLSGYSLKDFSWRTSDMCNKLKLPFMFAEYLNSKYPGDSIEQPAE